MHAGTSVRECMSARLFLCMCFESFPVMPSRHRDRSRYSDDVIDPDIRIMCGLDIRIML